MESRELVIGTLTSKEIWDGKVLFIHSESYEQTARVRYEFLMIRWAHSRELFMAFKNFKRYKLTCLCSIIMCLDVNLIYYDYYMIAFRISKFTCPNSYTILNTEKKLLIFNIFISLSLSFSFSLFFLQIYNEMQRHNIW